MSFVKFNSNLMVTSTEVSEFQLCKDILVHFSYINQIC